VLVGAASPMMKRVRTHFPQIRAIAYEGAGTERALAFRHYDPEEVIEGKTMSAHLRFSIAYWHSFRGVGADPFGPAPSKGPGKKLRSGLHCQGPDGCRFRVLPKDPGPILVLP